jgi:hypothetical protein
MYVRHGSETGKVFRRPWEMFAGNCISQGCTDRWLSHLNNRRARNKDADLVLTSSNTLRTKTSTAMKHIKSFHNLHDNFPKRFIHLPNLQPIIFAQVTHVVGATIHHYWPTWRVTLLNSCTETCIKMWLANLTQMFSKTWERQLE